MSNKFRKGQKVICLYYVDRPKVIVEEYIPPTAGKTGELWVKDSNGKLWWGPTTWFMKVGK